VFDPLKTTPYNSVTMKKVVLSISALKAMNFLLQTVITPTHSIFLVQDAIEGMHVLRTRSIVDVAIVDLDYDTQDNLEFINHIKSSRLYSQCKVIVLSSAVDIKLSETEKHNVNKIFSKPFSPVQLINYIDTLAIHNTRVTA
jgi:CheY-like chemotaxis protein